jgi:DNA-binding NarL/FixJ family response regulator
VHGGADVGMTAGSIRNARFALRSAHYDAALQLLEGCEDWAGANAEDGVVLKAQTLGRRDPIAALEYLIRSENVFASDAGRFGCDVEAGRLYAAVRDFQSAQARFNTARALASAVPDGPATMAFHDLRMRWFRRECNPDAAEIAVALTHSDASILAAVYTIRAWLHAGNGDYRAQVVDLMRSLACEPHGDEPLDVYTAAVTVQALARVSFETADEEGILAARQTLELLAWTPDVNLHHFETLRALGWDAFMRGESGRAQWTFKEARACAPSPAWRVMAHLDRAYVARIARNEIWAVEELDEADRIARDVRWEAAFGEERQVLVVLATLYAPLDAGRAQRYASMYSQIGVENVNPALAIADDRRAVAVARYAQAVIDLTLGRRDAAVPALLEAYEIFDSAGYHYRATLTASALAAVTGEDHWRSKSIAHAQRYPDCPLATLADDAVAREEALPRRLSPLQRQIARALLRGSEAADLSRLFSRSLYTIERQIVEIFEAFGVASRGELLHEARARGLA